VAHAAAIIVFATASPSVEDDRAVPRRTPLTMTSAWVYLLRCRDGSLYCGWTSDLERRLAAHRAGRASRYTASRLPVELALARPMDDRRAARREEARIKRLSRPQKLALIAARGGGAPG
jgi:putative endonuclease